MTAAMLEGSSKSNIESSDLHGSESTSNSNNTPEMGLNVDQISMT